MSTWVIYAAPEQDTVPDWGAFEARLAHSGITVVCDPKVGPRSTNAHIYVRDPGGVLSDPVKGQARADMLSRRTRALISNWREYVNREQKEKGLKGEGG